MFGKAFDCRVGVAAMLLALRELAKMDLPFDVVAAISSQEEVGERGVASSVRRFDPTLCYMFEGCPADDTFGIERRHAVHASSRGRCSATPTAA